VGWHQFLEAFLRTPHHKPGHQHDFSSLFPHYSTSIRSPTPRTRTLQVPHPPRFDLFCFRDSAFPSTQCTPTDKVLIFPAASPAAQAEAKSPPPLKFFTTHPKASFTILLDRTPPPLHHRFFPPPPSLIRQVFFFFVVDALDSSLLGLLNSLRRFPRTLNRIPPFSSSNLIVHPFSSPDVCSSTLPSPPGEDFLETAVVSPEPRREAFVFCLPDLTLSLGDVSLESRVSSLRIPPPQNGLCASLPSILPSSPRPQIPISFLWFVLRLTSFEFKFSFSCPEYPFFSFSPVLRPHDFSITDRTHVLAFNALFFGWLTNRYF